MDAPLRRIDATFTSRCVEGPVVVHAVRGVEALSRPFRYEVDLAATGARFDAVRGAAAHLELSNDLGEVRHVDGTLDSLSLAATDADADSPVTRLRAVIVPTASLLRLRRGFRIFQAEPVTEVVQRVFRDAGLGDERFRWTVGRSYAPREYVVQYDESEWDFASRLLEEEGICYWFEHTADGHVMVFADASDTGPAMEPGALTFTHTPDAHERRVRLWDWHARARASEDSVALVDYDLHRPTLDLRARATTTDPVHREWYEHPGRYADPGLGRRRAEDRLEALRAQRRSATARTNTFGAAPGRWFSLEDHPSEQGDYLVTEVSTHLRVETDEGEGPLVERGDPVCEIELVAVPRAQRFRPAARTPRPRVTGMQTAVVTGPPGQEIHCDPLGRVKVQFHWDRDGALDHRSSCWIRVAQAHTTGAIMIPRVGWEVLVEFVDGDPDRPLCMGRLWNALDPPPYPLPASKTISGHMSNSTPGAAGVNELRMDDAANAQAITLHGHRDITVHAANNKRAKTTRNEARAVKVDQAVYVGGDDQTAVLGRDAAIVGGDESVTIGGSREVKVSSEASDRVTGSFTLTVGASETLQVGNPSAAVLQIIESQAIAAAQAEGAAAASRAEAALLGPLMPAVGAARQALGPASSFLGASSGLLGANPSEALGLPSRGGDSGPAQPTVGSAHAAAQTPMALPDPSAMAAGMAGAVASRALSAAGLSSQGGGGGGGGGGAAGAGAGTWDTTVNGDVTEKIGGLAAINSVTNVEVTVGANAKDQVGAARIELVGGGRSESTGGSKTETVGVYMVNVSQGLTISAMAAYATNVAGSLRQKFSGGHGISAKGAAAVTASKVKGRADKSITLKCGMSEVVIDASGVTISGLNVTIQATGSLKLDPSDISPG